MLTQDYKVWYYENKANYELFLRKTTALIRSLLNSKDISYAVVQYRLKDLKGFLKKVKQLRGFNPKKVNDLAGIRIICYRVSQIKLIEQLIKANFKVLKIDDKLKDLGTDKMGYHALHIDATHTKRRVSFRIWTV